MTLVQTKDIDSLFFPQLDSVCEALSAPGLVCEPRHMMSVMMSESGVRADAWNDNPKSLPPEKRWNASGLIQFMPFILPGVGWALGHAEFRKLSATQQLPYVERYFKPHRGYLTSIGAIYTATFLPALLPHAGDPDFVLTAKDGPLGWAFAPNAVFDANKDYKITVRELEQAVVRNCRGPRWAELLARLEDGADVFHTEPGDDTLDENAFDLGTTIGIQRALDRLGFNPGKIDGIPGPRTAAAVAAWQKSVGNLKVDGVFGPLSRQTMEIALQTQA